jgi:two-component system response regulator YesN
MKSTFKRAEHIIQTQFMDIKNIKDIANMLNCKYNSLRPHFVRYTGRNMVTYLNEIRCMYAKKIIQTTDWKNYRIAKEVGFSSESYFEKVYKNMYGMTPSEARININE